MKPPNKERRIWDCFFLPHNVWVVIEDILNHPNMMGGVLILQNSIYLCWMTPLPTQGTPLIKWALSTLKRVQIMEALYLSNITIALPELSVIRIFRGKEHQESILNQVEKFFSRSSRPCSFPHDLLIFFWHRALLTLDTHAMCGAPYLVILVNVINNNWCSFL